jgi:hypothetical protein
MCRQLKGKKVYRKKTSHMWRTGQKLEKLIIRKPSKLRTRKRQFSSDLEEEIIVHLSDGSEDAECLHCCRLLSEDPEGEEWVCCARAHTHTLSAEQMKGPLCVSVTYQNNKKPFGAIETTYQIVIVMFLLQFVTISF